MKTTRKILSTREGTLAFAALAGAARRSACCSRSWRAYKNSVDEGAQPVTVLVATRVAAQGQLAAT